MENVRTKAGRSDGVATGFLADDLVRDRRMRARGRKTNRRMHEAIKVMTRGPLTKHLSSSLKVKFTALWLVMQIIKELEDCRVVTSPSATKTSWNSQLHTKVGANRTAATVRHQNVPMSSQTNFRTTTTTPSKVSQRCTYQSSFESVSPVPSF
eukprot:CAMPEP_0184647990 /NCGR_PEP_ID=MMETSP0308-20130426/5042_1 /TAXON_ID=38269 /ORGANISM="Gloeochaete witrockiana, Strain SAG 46.84" /LENGTH=152 /DNA_ID=CAMNT_0027079459 /DNA_START=484 /DNA_END=942 /DNA_ORIENTATION=-